MNDQAGAKPRRRAAHVMAKPPGGGSSASGAAPRGGKPVPGALPWPMSVADFFTTAEHVSRLLGLNIRSTPGACPAPCAPPGFVEPPEAPSSVDRLAHAIAGRTTMAISPVSLALAYVDWAFHLAMSPGKRAALVEKGVRKATRLAVHSLRASIDPATPPCIDPLPQDRRFDDPDWQQPPFRLIYQSFLLVQQWWHNATTGVHGVSRHHEQVAGFVARQLLDMVSPSNFIATNPELLKATLAQNGGNLLQGAVNWLEDWERAVAGRAQIGTEAFRPGAQVAVTPGRIVYRNRLIELIQYEPVTKETFAEPILIVPAWIMKYYILDLSPHNSLVRYLVERGHSVFMISWHNPGVDDRDLGMEDYLQLGVLEAVKVVRTIMPGARINAAGYCLGGTLLSIAAALLSRDGENPLCSMTLFAAQVDFTEAGELTLFIDESELAYLEDLMWDQGYLDTKQMAGAFQLLRSNDLIWSRLVRSYLLGTREPMSDLMAWNADATRMPYRMHGEYLEKFFLENDLVEGRYEVRGRPVALSDIRIPVFAVATESDHVAPWRSVYKLNLLLNTAISFLLTNGGHNAGIVSQPGHAGRQYRLSERKPGGRYADPDTWYAATPATGGSWWPAWTSWLERHASGKIAAPALGAPDKGYPLLEAAPGRYVNEP